MLYFCVLFWQLPQIKFFADDYLPLLHCLYAYICNTGTHTLMNEVSEVEASCEKLKASNKDLQKRKDRCLREIFTLTTGNVDGEILSQHFRQRMQGELERFKMTGQRDDEVLRNFQRDYVDWRDTLKQKMEIMLGTDKLTDMSEIELEAKLQTLKTALESLKNELSAFEEATKNKNSLLEGKIKALKVEVKMLNSLKLEQNTTHQRLKDALKEKRLKHQEDTNKLLKEIADLQKKLDLHE
ncbi:uncharacterized protein LOC128868191 isoform X2 [Anastrepha ludens]|uniref:uncharacterized protein LOC128868191 isoform X2 n=1 Tax=Anastrepha ludens TaxID=28586 RepID=UPI0023AF8D07|nr:uncharacterized protein LOC128868191 isoform X2 [Anastrepha ludens]